jgi:large conductance mechanosensitive channel
MANKATSLWTEFKSFAFKGNMLDLAVGVIIGAAFGTVISSLVNDILMPLLASIGAGGKGYEGLTVVVNGSTISYGKFIGALINFFIVALAIFVVIVKIVGSLMKKATAAPPAPSEPVTKECPLCLSVIPIKAKKCGHCTADLPA